MLWIRRIRNRILSDPKLLAGSGSGYGPGKNHFRSRIRNEFEVKYPGKLIKFDNFSKQKFQFKNINSFLSTRLIPSAPECPWMPLMALGHNLPVPCVRLKWPVSNLAAGCYLSSWGGRIEKNKGANETNILLTKMSRNPLNYRYFFPAIKRLTRVLCFQNCFVRIVIQIYGLPW